MTRKRTISFLILILSLLIADLAMVMFVFPLSSLGAFTVAALVPMLTGWARRVYDPASDIWEFSTLSPNSFNSWARRICDPKRYGPRKERFLSQHGHRVTPSMRASMLISKIRALTYVHALKLLLPLLGGLLIYDVYQVVGGHTAVWEHPRASGLGMGIVWGFCFGLFLLWRSCIRYQVEAQKTAAEAVKSS